MYNKKIFIAAVLFLCTVQLSVSQNNTNSPYTRFGYGDVTESTATELRGMGGVSLGNRSRNTISPLNPASYSSVDSLTFMFDIGGSARYSLFSDKDGSNKTFNANLEYLTMRFPIAKWLGVSAGLTPYSLVGYNFNQTDSLAMPVNQSYEDTKNVYYYTLFNGSGGFSQVYGGLSANILNHIALGANAYYMFGEVNNYRNLIFSSSSTYQSVTYANKIKASDFRFRYGIQLYNTFAEKHDVVLGAIYEGKTKFNGKYSAIANDSTLNSVNGFELPQTLGIGLNYTYNKQLTVGVDVTNQGWGKVLFFNKTDSLVNTTKIALGAEYIPNPMGRKYTDRIRYRIGFNTVNAYYHSGADKLPNNYTISLGVGFPTKTSKSMMNASLEYGKMGSSLLKENYLKLTFSASINEFWFVKPKL